MRWLKHGVLTALVVTLPAVAEPDDRTVVVGSKIDTEGAVLGELILQTLARQDIPVENRLQLGVTSVVREALDAGEIDLYPEYTGNGAFFRHGRQPGMAGCIERLADRARQGCRQRPCLAYACQRQ